MKLSKILLLLPVFFVSVSFLPSLAYAQSNFRSQENVELSSTEIIEQDYFTAGKRVSLNGTVNGDAFVAGGDVTVNGVIKGDLLVAGGNLNLNGVVEGNIRAVGGSLNINGSVGKSLTVVGGNIDLTPDSKTNGNLVVVGGEVNLGGSVEGSVTAAVGQLWVSPDAKVNGQVVYWSQKEANVSSSSTIGGGIVQNKVAPRTDMPREDLKSIVTGIGSMLKVVNFLSVALVGILFLRFFPQFTKRVSSEISQRSGASLGTGFVSIFLTPFIIVFLLLTIVGIPFAVLWAVLVFFVIWVSKIFVSYSIGLYINKYLKKSWSIYLSLTIGLVLYSLVAFVPLIGWVFSCVATLVGVGALLRVKKDYISELRREKVI